MRELWKLRDLRSFETCERTLRTERALETVKTERTLNISVRCEGCDNSGCDTCVELDGCEGHEGSGNHQNCEGSETSALRTLETELNPLITQTPERETHLLHTQTLNRNKSRRPIANPRKKQSDSPPQAPICNKPIANPTHTMSDCKFAHIEPTHPWNPKATGDNKNIV